MGGRPNWRLTSALDSHRRTSSTFLGCIASSVLVLGAYLSTHICGSDMQGSVCCARSKDGSTTGTVAEDDRGCLRLRSDISQPAVLGSNRGNTVLWGGGGGFHIMICSDYRLPVYYFEFKPPCSETLAKCAAFHM